MAKSSKRGPGRPPASGDDRLEVVGIRFRTSMLAHIDSIASARMDRPDRSAMIRELVAKGIESVLAAAQPKKGKP